MLTTNPLGIHPDLKQRLYFHRTGEHEVEICTAISDLTSTKAVNLARITSSRRYTQSRGHARKTK